MSHIHHVKYPTSAGPRFRWGAQNMYESSMVSGPRLMTDTKHSTLKTQCI